MFPLTRTRSPTWAKVTVPRTREPLRGSRVALAVGSFPSIMTQPETNATLQAMANTRFFMFSSRVD
jgi:hypothetical protein